MKTIRVRSYPMKTIRVRSYPFVFCFNFFHFLTHSRQNISLSDASHLLGCRLSRQLGPSPRTAEWNTRIWCFRRLVAPPTSRIIVFLGLWTFVRESLNVEIGQKGSWQEKDLTKFANHSVMPVPSAYNDMSADAGLRDHIGWVWYQKKEVVPSSVAGKALLIR